jgi:hypothetical protein
LWINPTAQIWVDALGKDGPDSTRLLGLVCRFTTSGVCCNQSGRYYHPDERKANQKIVHLSVSPYGFF